jgi:hypothetical protein
MNWIRIIRYTLAGVFAIQAIMGRDWLAGLLAVLLFVQAYTNTCCSWGNASCAVNNKESDNQDGVTFTEVK